MKILHLLPNYFIKKKVILGMEMYTHNLTIELDKLGIEQKIIAQTTDINSYKKINVYKLPKIGRFTFLRTGLEAYKLIKSKKIDFDILHQHNVGLFSIIKYKKELKKPFILTLHSSPILILKSINWLSLKSIKEALYYYFFTKLSIKYSDIIIVGSNECRNEIIKHFKVNENKVKYIPAGYNDKVFNLSKTKKKDQLLFVGRFIKIKGIITLLKAFREIIKIKPYLNLILIGADKNNSNYYNVINTIKKYNLNKNVKIIESIPANVLAKYYQSSKLVIAPSTVEATSQVGVEALACGTPVISTNISGFKDYVINNKTGFRVEIGDYNKISEIVLRIIDNKKLLKKLGLNGNKLVKNNFTWKKIAEKHKKLYKNLINHVKV